MSKTVGISIVVFAICFLIIDYFVGSSLYETMRFIIYGVFINLITHFSIIKARDKEIGRITEERNILQALLLKKERISSQKLAKAIRKAQTSQLKKKRK